MFQHGRTRFQHVSSRWVPDPTFLELAAVKTIFPRHNKQEWEDGIISSGALASFIGKIVSNDLSTLAPRLVGFLDNIQLDLATVNAMLLEQKTSGSSSVFNKRCLEICHGLMGGSANTGFSSKPVNASCICISIQRIGSTWVVAR